MTSREPRQSEGLLRRCALPSLAGGLTALAVSLLSFSCHPVEPASLSDAQSPAAALPPARIRRLTNAEIEQTATALLRYEVELGSRLPDDIRRDGYTRNGDQGLSATAAVRWSVLADELIEQALASGLAPFIKCPSLACRDAFLQEGAARAWRRPLAADELNKLRRLFDQGVADAGQEGGVRWVLAALMASPRFLYTTELGAVKEPAAGAVFKLTPYETAEYLAYTLTGAPPDAQLLAQAAEGGLASEEVRRAEARRLLSRSATRHHFRRFILEWLEVDELADTAKTAAAHPQYERLKAHMLEETRAYVDEVLVHHGASLQALLDGGFSSVDPSMARYYGYDTFGPVVPARQFGRIGLLQQASFLSAHALPDRTSPVQRGDFVLRRVLCRRFPRPAELGIEVVMPQVSPTHTTRELFEAHTSDPSCSACHQTIDALGYPFEDFDEAGRHRRLEAGKPIDTRASLDMNGQTLSFSSSSEVSSWLATLPAARECFARQAYRYFSAHSDDETERAFLSLVDGLPPGRQDNLIEMLVAYAGSDLFVYRRNPQ